MSEDMGAPDRGRRHEFHAVADLFPLLRGMAFDELVADIRKNGLREPILCDADGRILDGRNRYRACLAAGVEPRFVTWQGEESLPELALSLNLHRRHLGESQRAMVAGRLAKMLDSQRGEPAEKSGKFARRKSLKMREQAAGLVNVSPRLLNHALKVLSHGCVELIAAVESGQAAVSTASALAALPADEQARIVAGGEKEIAKKVRGLRSEKAGESASQPHVGVLSRAGLPADPLVFLGVPSSRLADAIEALQARGFRYTPAA